MTKYLFSFLLRLIKLAFLLIVFYSTLNANEKNKNISLQLLWKHQFQFAGYYMAKEKGFYNDVGLNVTIKPYEKGINIIEDVLNEKSEFGIGRSNLILEKINKNKEVLLLSAIYQQSPLILFAKKDSNIKTLEDIKNKKVMMLPNDNINGAINAMLLSNKIEKKDYEYIAHTFNINDLISNKVDLMSGYISNQPFVLKEKGIETTIFNPSDFGFDFYADILFTSKKYALNNQKVIDKFHQASLKGWQYAFSHIKESVTVLKNNYDSQNKSVESLLYEANILKKLAYVRDIPLGNINLDKLNYLQNTFSLLKLTNKSYEDLSKIIYDPKIKTLFNKEELNYLLGKKEIKLCIDPDWMPFEKLDKNGKHIGLSADIFDYFSKQLPININVVKTSSRSETLLFAKNKKCDIVSLAMSTPDRLKYLNFTKPYLDIPLVLATKPNVPFVNDFKNLTNKRLAIPKGYAFVELLKNKYPNLELEEVKNAKEGLTQVIQNKVFGYIGTLTTIGYLFQNEFPGELKIAGKFDEQWTLSSAVRKDDIKLLSIFEKLIDNLDQQNKNKIMNNWLSIKYEQGTDYVLIMQILVVVFIIIFIFTFRQYWLRKQNKILEKIVEDKTYALKIANKQLEQKAEQSFTEQQQLLTLFDEGNVSVFKWKNDDEQSVVYVSKTIKDLSGYSQEEFLSNKILYLTLIHQKDKDRVTEEIQKNLGKKLKFFAHKPYRIVTRNNAIKWVLNHTQFIKNKEGEITHLLGYVFDITELKEYETNLEQLVETKTQENLRQFKTLQQQAKLASMGEMLGAIAHQWRQPLNALSMNIQFLEDDYKDEIIDEEFIQKFTQENMQFINFMSKTIDDFRNFFRVDKIKSDYDIKECIEETINILKPQLVVHNIKLSVNTEDAIVNGFKNELQQVILNITNNAKDILLEYETIEPSIEITSINKDDEIIISIEDNGGGIPQDIIQRVFEPYFTTKEQGKGTGLGLYMSKLIIEDNMQGKLNVTNTKNGANFEIILPIAENLS